MQKKKKITLGRKRPSFLPSYKAVRNGKHSSSFTEGNLRKVYGWESKESSGWYSSPIIGFLNKNVGRKYDEVKSELYHKYSKEFERYTLESMLGFFVEKKRSYYLKNSFYVDEQGLLCKVAPPSKYKKKIINNVKKIDGKLYYKHLNIWYEITLASVPKFFFTDVFYGYYWYANFNKFIYGNWDSEFYNKYANSKRQLNKREIKKCQLK